jgi:hypothetical protein
MPKIIAQVWTFTSDSNPSKSYETLQYTDSSTSCNCPGWTRRVDTNGNRSCKHTRLVDQGRADLTCASTHTYKELDTVKPTSPSLAFAKPEKKKSLTTPVSPHRKIRWEP